jgi:hypothetical protein
MWALKCVSWSHFLYCPKTYGAPCKLKKKFTPSHHISSWETLGNMLKPLTLKIGKQYFLWIPLMADTQCKINSQSSLLLGHWTLNWKLTLATTECESNSLFIKFVSTNVYFSFCCKYILFYSLDKRYKIKWANYFCLPISTDILCCENVFVIIIRIIIIIHYWRWIILLMLYFSTNTIPNSTKYCI